MDEYTQFIFPFPFYLYHLLLIRGNKTENVDDLMKILPPARNVLQNLSKCKVRSFMSVCEL